MTLANDFSTVRPKERGLAHSCAAGEQHMAGRGIGCDDAGHGVEGVKVRERCPPAQRAPPPGTTEGAAMAAAGRDPGAAHAEGL